MDVNHKSSLYTLKKIRIFLIFFSFLWVFFSCTPYTDLDTIPKLDFQGSQAVQVRFKVQDKSKDYKVRLKGSSSSIFGEFNRGEKKLIFKPIIPFTIGETYELYSGDQIYAEFRIPDIKKHKLPKLLGIYPKLDTVPENLLKMYFVFNEPMQQTAPTLDFIKVYNVTEDKEVEIFLALENELWNAEKTELTLWLDPGRIKKDLIPNQERGIPIEKGNQYEIEVASTLKDQKGTPLYQNYSKLFYVGERDEEKPRLKNWQLTIPEVDTKSGLGVDFQESLDYLLIAETIQVLKGKEAVQGSFFVSKKGNSVVFIPEQDWEKGNYQIQIESRLEDLVGNNLNRLFDEDLRNGGEVDDSEFMVLEFEVE